MPKFDKQDLEGLISDAIADSLDVDWTSRDGARAVVQALVDDGIIVLLGPDDPKPGSNEWLAQSPQYHPGDIA